MRWLIRLLLYAFAVFVFLAGFAVYHFDQALHAPGPLAEAETVIVPRGEGASAIGRRLAETGVIEDPLIFHIAARFLAAERPLRAGEYRFPAKVTMAEALRILQEGATLQHSITIPEGLTSAEIVTLLNAEEKLTGDITELPPEGTLLPETYNFERGESRGAMIARMRSAQAEALEDLWPKRQEGLPLVSIEEAITLASIVEKETGLAAERSLVASVFINRLKRGMLLQSDPTVIYGLTGGKGPLARGLTRSDLAGDTPYNSYLHPGLPPGPIANPGRASIEAVLDPASTEFLYFVADGSGGHAFSKTLADHNRNVQRWRKIERERRQSQ